MLYRVDPYISLAVNKTRKEFLSGSPFSQIIKMLSHSKHVVSFAPCTCVQASALHPGTKTTYGLANSELSCLLYDSCLEDKILFYRDKRLKLNLSNTLQVHKVKKPEGFFSFVRVKFNAILYAVLTILLDEISLPKVYERDFIKNEKKTEFLTASNVK